MVFLEVPLQHKEIANARAWIYDDTIAEYDNELYDPSYGGNIHSSNNGNSAKKAWEHTSLETHGFRVEIKERVVAGNDGSKFKTIGRYLYRGAPDVLNIQETTVPIP